MTTVTVVGGDPKSGRALVAEAVSSHLRDVIRVNTFVVDANDSAFWLDGHMSNNLDDLILVSGSAGREPWMEPWFEKYGEPMFEIHIKRNDP